jgi:hypothetical protein
LEGVPLADEKSFAIVKVGDVNVDLSDLPLHTRKLCETLIVAGVWLVGPLRERWAAKARIASAQADSEVARIRRDDAIEDKLSEIKGDLEVADFQRRMTVRMQHRDLRRYLNIENIATGTVDFQPRQVSDEPVDQDWLAQFFEHCQDVSDPEMQSIWSHILAGEVAQPGRYSLRTLHAVKMLRKDDANLFTTYCKFVWSVDQWSRPWFFISAGGGAVGSFLQVSYLAELRDIYTREGITPEGRLHLQALNLVSAGGQVVPIVCTQTEPLIFHYHDRAFAVFDTPERPVRASPPYAPEICSDQLTDIGRELAPICGAKPHDRYRQLILDSIRCNQLRIADMT